MMSRMRGGEGGWGDDTSQLLQREAQLLLT